MPYIFLFVVSMLCDRAGNALLLAAVAFSLGLGHEADLFLIVTSVPTLAATILGDAVFVSLTRAFGRASSRHGGWVATGSHAAAFGVAFLAVTVAVMALALPIIRLLAPGMSEAALSEAVALQQLAAPLILVHGFGVIFSTALVCCGRVAGRVLRVSAANALAALAIIVQFMLVGVDAWTVVVTCLASTTAVTLLLAVWSVAAAGLEGLAAAAAIDRTAFRQALRGLSAVGSVNTLHNAVILSERAIASWLGPGAIATLTLARVVITLISALPGAACDGHYVAALFASGGRADVPAAWARGLFYGALAAGAPIIVVVLAKTDVIIALLFERGRFSATDTAAVTEAAMVFALGSLYHVLGTPLTRVLQFTDRDHLAAVCYLAILMLYWVLAPWGSRLDGAVGLAAAHSVAVTAGAAAMAMVTVRGLGWSALALPLPGILAAAGGAWLAIWAVEQVGPPMPGPLMELAVAVVVAAFAYGGVALALSLPGFRLAATRLCRTLSRISPV